MKLQKLSSSLTIPGVYLSALLTVVFIPVALLKVFNDGNVIAMLLGCLFLLGMIALHVYLFRFVCTASIEEDMLILKKMFQEPVRFKFDKIGEPKAIRIKNTVYTSVLMRTDGGVDERFLIVNSKSILSRNNIDVKSTLLELRNK